MDMKVVQNVHQEQKMILTADMQLSLKLLQMPINDLESYIDKELQENPVLEADYTTELSGEEIVSIDNGISLEPEYKDELKYKELLRQSAYENSYYEAKSVDYEKDDSTNPLNYVSEKMSLREYLKQQLIGIDESSQVVHVCEYIIENINDKGFILESTDDLAIGLGVSKDVTEYALSLIQDLEPWGIAARDLKECLKIQIRKMGIEEVKIYEIIDNYLELIGENKYKELAKILGINIEQVLKYTQTIISLEPIPSRGFYTGEETKYVLPEAYIRKIGDEYYILINDDLLPKLNINHLYRDVIKQETNKETIDFIKNKINSAISLIKGIEQRKNTIFRILEKIVKIQKEYFDKGEMYLKPMILHDIAEDLKLHDSTISRAVKDKYICTPIGTLKIKDLFTTGMASENNDGEISTNTIKKQIKKLIDEEDKLNPLSDQLISETLEKKNMKVSRRTVAKYREELSIRSSSKRKIIKSSL